MRKATVLATLLFFTTTSAGCDPDGTNSERPVHCEVIVDAPKKLDGANKLAGSVRFSCDRPGAEKLTFKMKLERRDGDNWHTVATANHTLKGLETHKGGWDRHSRSVEMACAAGAFRTVVDWTRVSRGNTDGDNLVSGVSRDPC